MRLTREMEKKFLKKEKSIEQKRSSIGHYYLRLYQLYRFFYLSSLSFHGSGILSVPELVGLQKEYDYTNHHRIYLLVLAKALYQLDFERMVISREKGPLKLNHLIQNNYIGSH